MRIAILDDYQDVALSYAVWDSLERHDLGDFGGLDDRLGQHDAGHDAVGRDAVRARLV